MARGCRSQLREPGLGLTEAASSKRFAGCGTSQRYCDEAYLDSLLSEVKATGDQVVASSEPGARP